MTGTEGKETVGVGVIESISKEEAGSIGVGSDMLSPNKFWSKTKLSVEGSL